MCLLFALILLLFVEVYMHNEELVTHNKKIPNVIRAVGCVSFFLNISTLIVFSYFSLYLKNVLNVDLSKIGFLEGAVDALSYAMKLFSGFLSDVLRNRKILFLLGATLLMIAKPLEAIGRQFWPLFFAKACERIGNGIQSTPRDALVGDWAPKHSKAICFGFRQSMGALGSVFGAIIAAILFFTFRNYQTVFWFACIPAAIAIIIIICFVKNKQTAGNTYSIKDTIKDPSKRRIIKFEEIKNLNKGYWVLLTVAALYNVARVSESLSIIYISGNKTIDTYLLPLLFAIFHASSSTGAIVAGAISDRINKPINMFISGIGILMLANIFFIFGKNNFLYNVCSLSCLGIYAGISQSIFPARIVGLITAELRGTGIGIYNITCAFSVLLGGLLIGNTAGKYGFITAFKLSLLMATLALLILLKHKYESEKSSHCRN